MKNHNVNSMLSTSNNRVLVDEWKIWLICLNVVGKLSDCPMTIPIMGSYCIPRMPLISLAQALLTSLHPSRTLFMGKENILVRFNHGNWVKQKHRWSELYAALIIIYFPGGSDGKVSAYNHGHGGEVWQNVVHWRREWQATSVFFPWEPHEQYEKAKW